jgi:hypothetical protein
MATTEFIRVESTPFVAAAKVSKCRGIDWVDNAEVAGTSVRSIAVEPGGGQLFEVRAAPALTFRAVTDPSYIPLGQHKKGATP